MQSLGILNRGIALTMKGMNCFMLENKEQYSYNVNNPLAQTVTQVISTALEPIIAGVIDSLVNQPALDLDNTICYENGVQKGASEEMKDRIRRNLLVANERVWLTGHSEQDIVDKAINIVMQKQCAHDCNMSKPEEDVTVTFGEYADKWLNIYKKKSLKPNTEASYRRKLNAHLLPAFSEKPISSISTEDVQVFMNDRSHLSRKTLRDLKALLGQIMKDALDEELIAKDPTESRRLSIPSDKSTKREALPLDQFKEILENLNKLQDEDHLLMTLLMLTGMRRGEVLGLKWEDIDFDSDLIHVRRNVTHPDGNTPIIGTPKTKSGFRDIPLDPTLKHMLNSTNKAGFVFGGDHPISMRTYNNTWERIKKKIDLHDATAHVLRHSYLTYIAGTGIDLKTLQTIAGHSTISMTLNQYVHPQKENILDAGKQFHKVIFEEES